MASNANKIETVCRFLCNEFGFDPDATVENLQRNSDDEFVPLWHNFRERMTLNYTIAQELLLRAEKRNKKNE